jgi:hypothetical protein
MSFGLEVRDPIHGFIYREPYEKKIIDTRIFQRLRGLRQLAMEHLVYPGAVHTRFEHSLGAFHIAGNIAAKLLPGNEAECRLVRLAALLHDIGHGPFSHVSEPILQRFARKSFKTKEGQQIHELISANIITNDAELARILGEDEREQIVGLLQGTDGYALLKDIVSGPLDADKQDYLLRDSYYCGVRYGVYDVERLRNTLRVHETADDRFLAISSDGINSLEQFVLAKYYMTIQVYRHRVRLITDAMISRGIALGIEEDKVTWLKDLYSYDGSKEHTREFLRWHDDLLISEILSDRTKKGYAKGIFKRLAERRLFKCIFSVNEREFTKPEIRKAVFAGSADLHRPLEKAIAEAYKLDKNLVIANTVSLKPATKTESEVMVLDPAGPPRVFHDASTFFRSVNEAIREEKLEVYAPVEFSDDRDKKKRMGDYHREILEIVKRVASPKKKHAAN